jgi:hypothetical protein
MTQDEDFKKWWFNEGSQPPYTHHDCEEHTMRMCEIAWANGAYKEREACASCHSQTQGEEHMSNVILFNGITKLDLEPDMVLENTKGKLKGVILIGYDKEGEEYFASTYADGGDVLWLLERMKLSLLNVEANK